MVVLLVVIGFLLFFVIGIVSSILFFPISLNDIVNGMDFQDPEFIPVLKNLQIWQSLGIFVVPSFLVAWFAAQKPWNFLGLDRSVFLRPSLWVILALIVSMPFMNQIVIWNENLILPDFLSGIENWMREREDIAADLTNSFLIINTIPGLLLNILMIAIIPAFGEEFFFRGIIQKLFGRWFRSDHLAVVLASILFSALHFQFYGFLPRFLLGLIFGYLYLWSGNLWYPIIAHLFNNIIPVIAFYLYGEEAVEGSLDQIGTGQLGWVWVVGSLVLAALALYQFKKLSSPQVNSIKSN